MAKLQIENTFERIDPDGTKWTRNINKAIEIELLQTSYTLKRADESNIELIPADEKIYAPIWTIIDKEDCKIRIFQSIGKTRSHRHVAPDFRIENKTTGEELLLTTYSPVLTPEEYEYFCDMLNKEVTDIKWETAEDYLETDLRAYLRDTHAEYIDAETVTLLAEFIMSRKAEEIMEPGYVDFDSGLAVEVARDTIKDAISLLLAR